MGGMGRVDHRIEEREAAFIARQRVFFVATAPSGPDGHVNLSPKGLAGTFQIIDPTTVAYLDLTGSGAETIAHLRDNGRIVLMFCALDGPPRIVRLHGRGEAVLPDDPRFSALRARFPDQPGVRSVILVSVERVSDSCGFGVPVYAYQHERDDLPRWAGRKGPEELARYQREKNATSIDGLPAVP